MRPLRHDTAPWQVDALADVVDRIRRRVPFTGARLQSAGIDGTSIRTLADLRRLPFTTKDDLRSVGPEAHWAVGRSEIARVHISSGTTGAPTVAAYTRRDLVTWANLVAGDLRRAGIRRGSVVHVGYPLGLSTGGFGFTAAAEQCGALAVPAGTASYTEQLRIIELMSPRALLCTPNDAVGLVEAAAAGPVDGRRLSPVVGVFGGESWSQALRRRLEAELDLEAFDVYGLSEVIGPGVASECGAHTGLHVADDHFLVEIVRPDSDEVCEPGELGELVVTTLRKEAMPLLRYRTGDVTRLVEGPCRCESLSRRIDRVRGRLAERLDGGSSLAGAVFPADVEQAVLSDPHASARHAVRLDGTHVSICVEAATVLVDIERLRRRLSADLERLLPGAHVVVCEPGSVARRGGKREQVVAGSTARRLDSPAARVSPEARAR